MDFNFAMERFELKIYMESLIEQSNGKLIVLNVMFKCKVNHECMWMHFEIVMERFELKIDVIKMV